MKFLCFFDIDGTIAENNQPPPPKTAAAIRRLRQNGHKAFICTARTMCDIYDSLLEVGFDGIIAGAGAHILVEGKEIFHHFIPEKALLETVAGIYENGFSGVLEGTENIYFIPGAVELDGDWPRLRGPEEVSTALGIEKFTIHTRDHAHIDQVVAKMPQLLRDYELYKNNSGSFGEFVWKGINKASGIEKVAAWYKTDMKYTAAFGDSMNDAPALQIAGVGVAMGNAPEELKACAALVTAGLKEDGVAAALEKLKLI